MKIVQSVKQLDFDDVPELKELEEEWPSDNDQDAGSDSDEEPAFDEMDELKWSRKIDAVIFQFAHAFEIVRPILNRVGRKVYAAIRKCDDLPVVIIVAQDTHLAQRQQGLPREVLIMAQVRNHPNVANLLGWKKISRRTFVMLTEHFIECDTSTCFWSKYLIAEYLNSLLTGLEFLRKQGISHRDMCTDNVMWDPLLKKAVIVDFDSACFSRDGYVREVGRDEYDAPEKADVFLKMQDERYANRDVGEYTDAADMYSVGIIMWMLLRQELDPPNPRYVRHIVEKALERKKYREDIAWDLMLKMLTTDPQLRITPTEALEHDFFRDPDWLEPDEHYVATEPHLHNLLHFEEPQDESDESDESAGDEPDEESEQSAEEIKTTRSDSEREQSDSESECEELTVDNFRDGPILEVVSDDPKGGHRFEVVPKANISDKGGTHYRFDDASGIISDNGRITTLDPIPNETIFEGPREPNAEELLTSFISEQCFVWKPEEVFASSEQNSFQPLFVDSTFSIGTRETPEPVSPRRSLDRREIFHKPRRTHRFG
jgi:serine/threonine protein kinase